MVVAVEPMLESVVISVIVSWQMMLETHEVLRTAVPAAASPGAQHPVQYPWDDRSPRYVLAPLCRAFRRCGGLVR